MYKVIIAFLCSLLLWGCSQSETTSKDSKDETEFTESTEVSEDEDKNDSNEEAKDEQRKEVDNLRKLGIRQALWRMP